MEQVNIIEKLKEKANVSYEKANEALENSNWDMLDAMVYLEAQGYIKKPSVSVFYSNKHIENNSNHKEIINLDKTKEKKNNNWKYEKKFNGIFEAICEAIDTGNNFFIEIRKGDQVFSKIPLTVLIILLFFIFWLIIPLIIVGLFFDIEFFVTAKKIDKVIINKINKTLTDISRNIKVIKDKFKKGV